MAQHTTKLPISVTVISGDIQGYSAFYESNPQGSSASDIAKIELSIDGATYEAINGGRNPVYSEDFT